MAEEMEKGGGLPGWAIGAVIVVLVVVVAAIVLSRKEEFEPVGPGTEALAFTLPDLDGKPKSLSDFRGKVVFLNFWATWCDPCKDEMPSMEALYKKLKDRPFEIVAVSVDKDPADTVKEFVKKFGITFTVLHDRKGVIKERYKTTGVPETFIIDQNGVIAEKFWGPRDWTDKSNLGTIFDLLSNGPRPAESYKKKGKKG